MAQELTLAEEKLASSLRDLSLDYWQSKITRAIFGKKVIVLIKEAGWKSPEEWELLISMLAEKQGIITNLKTLLDMWEKGSKDGTWIHKDNLFKEGWQRAELIEEVKKILDEAYETVRSPLGINTPELQAQDEFNRNVAKSICQLFESKLEG